MCGFIFSYVEVLAYCLEILLKCLLESWFDDFGESINEEEEIYQNKLEGQEEAELRGILYNCRKMKIPAKMMILKSYLPNEKL